MVLKSPQNRFALRRRGRDIASARDVGNRMRGPTVAGIWTHSAGQVDLPHCKIADTQELRQIHRASRMACPKIALTMLILGSVMIWGADARAQAGTPEPTRLAQTPTPPTPSTPPTTPPSPPAASQPAAPTAQQAPDPVGSVATLQGSASVTRNNATSALALRDPVYKTDVLQTNVDGTLGITFDDETTFTLKPNTRLAVDEFVYEEGGANNAAVFNVVRGTAAFVAAEVAHTGNMRIDTPSSTLGIRGTTGLVEVPEDGAAGGQVSIKLYPDADGRVGRIEVFGRDGAQLGILSRGATGFAVRPGAAGRFSAVPLQISALEAERDRSFVRQAFAARTVGRQINLQRRTLQQQQRNQLRPNQPNQQRPGQLPGREQRPGLQQQRPELRTVPGGQPLPSPAARPTLQQQPGAVPPGGRPNAPTLQQQPGGPPTLQRQPGALPGLQRAPAGQRKPAKKNEGR
jgi:hypothetical protein